MSATTKTCGRCNGTGWLRETRQGMLTRRSCPGCTRWAPPAPTDPAPDADTVLEQPTPAKPAAVNCRGCSKPFVPPRTKGRRRGYCTDQCRENAYARHQREKARLREHDEGLQKMAKRQAEAGEPTGRPL